LDDGLPAHAGARTVSFFRPPVPLGLCKYTVTPGGGGRGARVLRARNATPSAVTDWNLRILICINYF